MAISFVEKLAYINKNAKGDENLLKAVKYGRGIDKIQDEEKKKKVKDLVNKAFMKIKELNTSKTKDPKKKIEAEIEKFKKSIGRTKWLTATKYMTRSGLRKTTIEKDAVLSALPKGKRISRKTGKPYWENRANRSDVKQPPKTYPKLADGGKINMDDIKKRAIFYTDESKWSTKPTISKFQEENKELKETLKKLENKEITPSKIIGGGYKSSAIARKLAFQYLEERILVNDMAIEILKERGEKFAKGGKVGQKVFVAEEDGILGIADGSDAYSIEISKGDTFVTYGEQDDMNWWYVKKVNKKPTTMSESNDFDYTKSKSRVKVNWDELLLTFPKGDKMIYAQMIESKAKGGGVSEHESKFEVDDVVYNKKTKTIGIVRMQDDKHGEVKTDADGNVDVDDLEHYNPLKYAHQGKADVAPSTKKEIEERMLWKPFASKKYGHGGTIAEGNYHMILSQAKEVKHHVAELQDILKNQKDIDAWVVAKMENASSTLSDITHYLDGKTEKK
jgi:hypothetical protein